MLLWIRIGQIIQGDSTASDGRTNVPVIPSPNIFPPSKSRRSHSLLCESALAAFLGLRRFAAVKPDLDSLLASLPACAHAEACGTPARLRPLPERPAPLIPAGAVAQVSWDPSLTMEFVRSANGTSFGLRSHSGMLAGVVNGHSISIDRNGAKLRRWMGQGPSARMAARCCGVP